MLVSDVSVTLEKLLECNNKQFSQLKHDASSNEKRGRLVCAPHLKSGVLELVPLSSPNGFVPGSPWFDHFSVIVCSKLVCLPACQS